jgi:hypothetical protein
MGQLQTMRLAFGALGIVLAGMQRIEIGGAIDAKDHRFASDCADVLHDDMNKLMQPVMSQHDPSSRNNIPVRDVVREAIKPELPIGPTSLQPLGQ